MLGQVVVGAVGDAHEFAPLVAGEPELVLEVDGARRVVRALVVGDVEAAHVLRVDAQVDEPVPAVLDPALEPLVGLIGLDEELDLHLLELAGAEDEVAGGDLVAERLADLTDAERRLTPGRGHDVLVVDEDALRGLRTQVVQAGLVVHGAEVRLHQAGEQLRIGPLPLGAAVGARDLGHRGVGHRVELLFGGVRLLQVVLTQAGVAVAALHERIREGLDVARGLPHLAGQDDRGVQAHDVLAARDERAPPLLLDVVLELHAQGAVVPRRARPAVDLATLVHQSPALAEIDDGVDDGR